MCKEGVKSDLKKLEAVRNYPRPKTVGNIRQFVGLAGYYRQLIKNFSGVAKHLSNLLKNDVAFEWNDYTQKAFDVLKDQICKQPVLQFPNF